MYIYGKTLIYPSLPNQTSFSTNHYEDGVHSVADKDAPSVRDVVREDVDVRFTVPLVRREDAGEMWAAIWGVEKAVAEIGGGGGVEGLPVVGMEHRIVEGGIKELVVRGKKFVKDKRVY
jgi:hypothetical protein